MFSNMSKKLAKKLIQAETINAIEHYGSTYKDSEEAEAVLVEEIQEAEAELDNLYMAFAVTNFDRNTKDELKRNCEKMKKAAINGIKELAQVCAVLNKIEYSGLEAKC